MRFPTLALILVLGLVPATAQRPRPDRAPEPPRMGLHLSADQKQQMETLRARHKEAIASKRKALDEARKAFQDAVHNPETTMEALRPLHQALADRQFDFMQAQRGQRLAVRELLSPEQRERAERLRGRHEGMRWGRDGMGHGMMPGRHPGAGPMMGRMAERLGLSEDQKKALKELHEKQRGEGPAMSQQLHEARKAFLEAAEHADAKPEELKKLHNALAEAQFQAMTARRTHRAAMEKILTPDQRERVKQAMERRAGFRGRR